MAASKDFRRAHLVDFRLQMFAYPVATSTFVAFALFLEPELGHDGAETVLDGADVGLDQYARIIKRQYHEKHSDQ